MKDRVKGSREGVEEEETYGVEACSEVSRWKLVRKPPFVARRRVEDDKTTVLVHDSMSAETGTPWNAIHAVRHATGREEELLFVVEDGEESNLRLEDGPAPSDQGAEDGVVLEALYGVLLLLESGRGGSGSRDGGGGLEGKAGGRVSTRRSGFARGEVAAAGDGAGGAVGVDHGVGGRVDGSDDVERRLTGVHRGLLPRAEEVETVDDALTLRLVLGERRVEGAVLEGGRFLTVGGDAVGRERRIFDVDLELCERGKVSTRRGGERRG